jgi:peroxiredoxin
MSRTSLSHGVAAPEIGVPPGLCQTWGLHDLRRKPAAVAVSPADSEPISTGRLSYYNHALPTNAKSDAELVGIVVNGVWCRQAFAARLRVRFPLRADPMHPSEAGRDIMIATQPPDWATGI